MISAYLDKTQTPLGSALIESKIAMLEEHLSTKSAQSTWSYQIPELGEGGSCSLFGNLQDAPFLLNEYIDNNERNDALLSKLQAIVDFVHNQTGVDWFGIYQARLIEGERQLLKLAYEGAPSRPLFPINEQFAATSNNIQTVMSEKSRIINDIPAYIAQGGEYYTCDPKVQSEVCLPLLDDNFECVGIIDAEAFSKDFFTADNLSVLVAACLKITHYLPH
ncbi:histidine kinase [Pseudoalteromonas luteoviolacea]|uniref:GAF domain-containing protein n=1 Tax=Pseudoalteromonas luteoviolacea TaxID=43657 RepID=UPI001B397DF2|nr:GAF domain-containing protein [Pseudoalteromonas luteoviolacea]MBQ4812332.1 histidine kinase [Pseudoalteromonas luteoviolacea]